MAFTYFQGFLFNQNISNREEAEDYLNTMFNNEPVKNIIFINDYSNIYFKTYTIKDDILTKIYEEAILSENDKKIIVRDNIHIYHFFRYNKKNNNHIELYKLVSNIENMTRLLISFATYLAPNIDHKLFMKERIKGANLNEYYSKYLYFKDNKYTLQKFILENNIEKAVNSFKKYWETKIEDYSKIRPIIRELENLHNIHDIRAAIGHNHMMLSHNANNFKVINYITSKEKCLDKYNSLKTLLNNLLEKYNFNNNI